MSAYTAFVWYTSRRQVATAGTFEYRIYSMSDQNGGKSLEKEDSASATPATPVTPATPATPATPTTPLASWLDGVLWLGPRVAESRAATFRSGRPGFEFYDIARKIRDDTVRIRETSTGSWIVLVLDCIIVELLVRAHLARAGLVVGPGPLREDDWARAPQVPPMQAAWGKLSAPHASTLIALLGADRVSAMTKLSDAERESFAVRLRELVLDLAEPLEFEATRLGRALLARWLRVTLTALMVVLVVGFVGDWVAKKIHPNLAFHRPVTVSSVISPEAPDPSQLVDGKTNTWGFHTNNGAEQQWVVIDLGEVKHIEKIVVYNRLDCCSERAVPLKVEVSKDNQSYQQIAERTETFEKWAAKDLHAEGRYVRLKNTPPNWFHLAEVEVY